MTSREEEEIDDPVADDDLLVAALRRAVAAAIEVHRRLGNPIAVWRDGRVAWLQPEEIAPSEEPPDARFLFFA